MAIFIYFYYTSKSQQKQSHNTQNNKNSTTHEELQWNAQHHWGHSVLQYVMNNLDLRLTMIPCIYIYIYIWFVKLDVDRWRDDDAGTNQNSI